MHTVLRCDSLFYDAITFFAVMKPVVLVQYGYRELIKMIETEIGDEERYNTPMILETGKKHTLTLTAIDLVK